MSSTNKTKKSLSKSKSPSKNKTKKSRSKSKSPSKNKTKKRIVWADEINEDLKKVIEVDKTHYGNMTESIKKTAKLNKEFIKQEFDAYKWGYIKRGRQPKSSKWVRLPSDYKFGYDGIKYDKNTDGFSMEEDITKALAKDINLFPIVDIEWVYANKKANDFINSVKKETYIDHPLLRSYLDSLVCAVGYYLNKITNTFKRITGEKTRKMRKMRKRQRRGGTKKLTEAQKEKINRAITYKLSLLPKKTTTLLGPRKFRTYTRRSKKKPKKKKSLKRKPKKK